MLLILKAESLVDAGKNSLLHLGPFYDSARGVLNDRSALRWGRDQPQKAQI